MNAYGNKIGFHNPKSTMHYYNVIFEQTNLHGDDTSWHNDLSDSVFYAEKNVQIYFPNDQIATFEIFADGSQNESFTLQTIEEVINYIKK